MTLRNSQLGPRSITGPFYYQTNALSDMVLATKHLGKARDRLQWIVDIEKEIGFLSPEEEREKKMKEISGYAQSAAAEIGEAIQRLLLLSSNTEKFVEKLGYAID